MDIRPVNERESVSLGDVMRLSYYFQIDEEDYIRHLKKRNEGETVAKKNEAARAVFDNTGKLCTSTVLHDFKVRFDGHEVGMGGIGGVATLPEERRKGHVRAMFQNLLPEMRDRGMLFSYLYPFSMNYYAMYGYSQAYNRHVCQLETYQLKMFVKRREVTYRLVEPEINIETKERRLNDNDARDLSEVYNAFIKDRNLAVVRDTERLNRHFAKIPFCENRYTYICYSDGSPTGYVSFSIDDKVEQRCMDVAEICFKDQDAFGALMELLYQNAYQIRYVKLALPADMLFFIETVEGFSVKTTLNTQGMNRVVDAEAVLKLARIDSPLAKGRFSIKVSDQMLDWNNHTFLVEWENAERQVSIADSTIGADADLTVDIGRFTQLVTGYASARVGDMYFMPKQLFIGDFF